MIPDIKGPLERAINEESADWLEINFPLFFYALKEEIADGKKTADIAKILDLKFGPDIREPFRVRLIQAADHLISEQAAA